MCVILPRSCEFNHSNSQSRETFIRVSCLVFLFAKLERLVPKHSQTAGSKMKIIYPTLSGFTLKLFNFAKLCLYRSPYKRTQVCAWFFNVLLCAVRV